MLLYSEKRNVDKTEVNVWKRQYLWWCAVGGTSRSRFARGMLLSNG